MTALDTYQTRTAGRWTKQQHQKFLYGLELYGKNWKKIEDLIQTRTSTQIRSHAQKFFIKIKRTDNDDDQSENVENSSHTKFAQQTIVSPHEESNVENSKSDFSFYLQKIVKNYVIFTRESKEFNFWESLIDFPKVDKHRSCQQLEVPREFEVNLKRNASFQEPVHCDEEFGSEFQRTEFSCFQEYKGPN